MAIKRLRDLEGSEIDGDSIRTANFLLQLSRGDGDANAQEGELSGRLLGRVFECKTCNRQFGSFQALGGHRASHKKPRIVDGHYKQSLQVKPKVHECSICGLEFAIGQALGGHMRRHRNEIMQHDEVIWQTLRHNHCSFMTKIATGNFSAATPTT
ncbi:hypothetical protein MRB53_029335 [Persea americana]|uniref:Uncharacterized protein n=1 Tax=Persea americana TaxID=3435 RepID=A0ACC2KI87_PERAE|nr:hypothetical protein MRB53_029335 [Persea americana]